MTPSCRPLLLLLTALGCVSREAPTPDSARTSGTSTTPTPAPVLIDSAARHSAASRWVVTPAGIGPVRAGMTLTALGTALGEPVRAKYDAGSRCAHVQPAALPKGVLVMVQDDTVARVDVQGRGVLTADGAGVGDTEASVLERYAGRVRTSPHKYTGPAGHYLTISAPPDTTHLIIFETDGRTVVNYRAGRRPAVELVEGCS
jgi:hypothetical protein